jgi:hypothetical protein
MKRILQITFLAISGFASAQFGNLQNNSLENWAVTDSTDNITSWFWNRGTDTSLARKSADAQNLTYSVKLSTKIIDGTEESGILALGDFSQGFAGIPYASPVDSIVGFFKYNLMPGDSASIIVLQFQGGNMIPSIFKFGGVQANWTRRSFKLLSPFQDSIAIIYASSDIFNGIAMDGSTLSVDNVSMKGTAPAAVLPNNSFENYTTVYVDEPVAFSTTNQLSGANGFEAAVTRVTDAQAGTYAAKLQAVGAGQGNIPGFISNGTFDGQGDLIPVAYTAQPDSLTAWVKYTSTAGDAGEFGVEFFKNGASVASGVYALTNTISAYTKILLPLTYTDVPDSMLFFAFSGNETTSILTIDNINFRGGNVGVEEIKDLEVKMYPNPAQDVLTVSAKQNIETIAIYTIDGQLVKNIRANNIFSIVNVSDLSTGVYMVQINAGNNSSTQRLVIR